MPGDILWAENTIAHSPTVTGNMCGKKETWHGQEVGAVRSCSKSVVKQAQLDVFIKLIWFWHIKNGDFLEIIAPLKGANIFLSQIMKLLLGIC